MVSLKDVRSISRNGNFLSFSRRKLAATIPIYIFVYTDSVISSIGFCEDGLYDELGLHFVDGWTKSAQVVGLPFSLLCTERSLLPRNVTGPRLRA